MNLTQIVAKLNRQEVVAYPTESVFGLGCDPDSEVAVQQLLQLKQRSIDKGLILIAADYQQLLPYIDDQQLNDEQHQLLNASWPGPITWVLPMNKHTPYWLTGKFNSLAVRVSAHPDVQKLCRAFTKPLVSTSANLSGQPACKTSSDVYQQFGDQFPVLDGEVGDRINPSEIRNILTGELLRKG